MKENSQNFFQNRQCPYFPCHDGADEETFNCLFCYCPLYALGENCGGHYSYTQRGIKNCTNCHLPHREGGYEYVLSKFPQIAQLAKRKTEEEML